MNKTDEARFMGLALEEARKAADSGEVPVGAVAVLDGQVVARGHNQPIALVDPTAHAEILTLREASRSVGAYRLPGLELYVTLEPCVMCVGALVTARVARVIYGTRDEKAGALGSVYDIGRDGVLNHRLEVVAGIIEQECAAVLREFFRSRREQSP